MLIQGKIYALVAWESDQKSNLKIIDVSDPKNPALVRNINTDGYAYVCLWSKHDRNRSKLLCTGGGWL